MRLVLQRVSYGAVRVANELVGEVQGPGLVLLVGLGPDDHSDELRFWAQKCVNLRVFPDQDGKMNLSLAEIGGGILAVSQFTLYGDTRKGRRPGFSGAAAPDKAAQLYEEFLGYLRETGVPVASGIFQAHMDVEIHNDGPVTLLLGSDC
jgi:D-aminoacyl-tRNA deacylase